MSSPMLSEGLAKTFIVINSASKTCDLMPMRWAKSRTITGGFICTTLLPFSSTMNAGCVGVAGAWEVGRGAGAGGGAGGGGGGGGGGGVGTSPCSFLIDWEGCVWTVLEWLLAGYSLACSFSAVSLLERPQVFPNSYT